jgi:hypothetical protein
MEEFFWERIFLGQCVTHVLAFALWTRILSRPHNKPLKIVTAGRFAQGILSIAGTAAVIVIRRLSSGTEFDDREVGGVCAVLLLFCNCVSPAVVHLVRSRH